MTADRAPAMFDPGAESMPAEQRAGLQQARLSGMIDRLLAAGRLPGRRLAEAGVTGGADVTLADLPRLPMTSKADLWSEYPFRMLAVPLSDVVAVHGSSGTGGRPTLVAYTRGDLRLWAQMCARALAAAGATAGSYAIRLGEALAAAGLRPGDGLALRAGIFGAEPWTDELRARISELLGLRALDIYGLSEVIGPGVASECFVAADGLHVNEDHFLVEAVDPVTSEPVPDGTAGELVFSTVTKEALPVLRYRTGDIAALRRGTCACGRTLTRMSKITGRRDDMLVIRGVNVYPSEVERVLLGEPALAPDYLLVVDERAAEARLVACCEYVTDGQAPAPQADEIESRLRDALGISVGVRLVPAGTVPRTEVGKAVRVTRWRGGEPPLPGIG